jgi:hypothetical protein
MINKILFTIFAIIAIWKAFSFLAKLNKSKATSLSRTEPPDRTPRPETASRSIELVPCTRCGAYVDPRQGCRCTASNS